MRTKSFSFSLSDLRKLDDEKKREILLEAEIIQTGDASILKVGNLYTNSKEDAFYFVREIKNFGSEKLEVHLDPLLYIGNQSGERISDVIKGKKLLVQTAKVLNFKRKLLGE